MSLSGARNSSSPYFNQVLFEAINYCRVLTIRPSCQSQLAFKTQQVYLRMYSELVSFFIACIIQHGSVLDKEIYVTTYVFDKESKHLKKKYV